MKQEDKKIKDAILTLVEHCVEVRKQEKKKVYPRLTLNATSVVIGGKKVGNWRVIVYHT